MKKIILLATILGIMTSCGLVQRINTQRQLKKEGYGNCTRVSPEFIACSKIEN